MVEFELNKLPDSVESGYREGVWLTELDITNPDLINDEDLEFEDGTLFFLIFTTNHLGAEPQGDRKNLMGVELTYFENKKFIHDWGLKINKYVDLGTLRGKKEWKRKQRLGEFNHISATYGEGNVKFISFAANFDELAGKILRYVGHWFKPLNFETDAPNIIRYYRSLHIPETEKVWYSGGHWLDKESFEINVGINLEYLEDTPSSEYIGLTGIIFTSNNFLVGNQADLGVFLMIFEELPDMGFFDGGGNFELIDFIPYQQNSQEVFKFLGFIGPSYKVPNLYTIEEFLNGNDVLWEDLNKISIDFFYAGIINSFADLRPAIVESVVDWSNPTTVRKMNIFK
jgi:hypothetical protein